jgi:gentisate 1,2-dioxygenase
MSRHPDPAERAKAYQQVATAKFYEEALEASKAFRAEYETRLNVVKAEQMPFERSPDGLIKHIVNEKMNTKEECIDIYMQFLLGGAATGKSRHLSEEVAFVLEGNGYDLHWDVNFECKDKMDFDWVEEPQRFDWQQGDFIYVPPYSIHKRFNGDAKEPARIVVVNSRIIKDMGFDWIDQLEGAEGF